MSTFSNKHLSEPLHVLLIEDDEGDRDLALEYLKADSSHLYQVTWAPSLEAGLQQLETIQFDVIILDLVLPDSRGVTTVSKLCARSQGIPVIVSSYFDESALASKVIELGAQDYLTKDLMDTPTLSRTLSRALARAKHQANRLSEQHLHHRRRETVSQNADGGADRISDPGVDSDPLAAKVQQLQSDIYRLEAVAHDINQTADRQRLDEMRQRMVTTLSHECRSPATVILLASNVLKSYDQNIKDEQYLATVTRLDAAVRQMMQLIDNALNFHQVPSLVAAAKPEHCDLQSIYQRVIAQLETDFGATEQITVEYPENNQAVCSYPAVIEQVLMQLLTNAIQYSQKSAELLPPAELSKPHRPDQSDSSIAVTFQNSNGHITLQVKDQGRGIPDQEQDRVFEPFYRLNYVENIHGIGLGLTIVKTCVEMCGGQVALTSHVDEGTTVTVMLPEATPEPSLA